jgi:hypothetical protein
VPRCDGSGQGERPGARADPAAQGSNDPASASTSSRWRGPRGAIESANHSAPEEQPGESGERELKAGLEQRERIHEHGERGGEGEEIGDPCGTPSRAARRIAAEDERGPHRGGRRADNEHVAQHEQGGGDKADGADREHAGRGESGRGQDADVQAGDGQQVREAGVGERAAGLRIEAAAFRQQDSDGGR